MTTAERARADQILAAIHERAEFARMVARITDVDHNELRNGIIPLEPSSTPANGDLA